LKRKKRRSLIRWIAKLIWCILLLGMIGWGTLAIYYSYLPETLRTGLAVIYALGSLIVLIFIRRKIWADGLSVIFFAAVLMGWLAMSPSNDRDWQEDVAVLPHATISGNTVTIHNIRNCDYRSEADYTVRYYDLTVDMAKLSSLDLYLVDWGLKHVVHTMLSFGFEDGRYICISIETRKEKGEAYSTVKGFFRQYELFYVVADERDLVRLRTNYRKGETVYLYRLGGSLDVGRQIFLDYMRYINGLKAQPEWYNALTGNCTTQIRGHTRPYTGRVRWDWRILANGYIDKLAYEQGLLDASLSFEELKQRSAINTRAMTADKDASFSSIIRKGLPGIKP
jgi:hypothetical protein